MDKKTEIISFVERRRRWSRDEKLRILAEAFEPGATAAAVADRNGVSRSLLYNWLKLAREGRMPGVSVNDAVQQAREPSFMPVRVDNGAAVDPAPPPLSLKVAKPDPAHEQMVEIALRSGRVILRVADKIDPKRLARIVTALEEAGKP